MGLETSSRPDGNLCPFAQTEILALTQAANHQRSDLGRHIAMYSFRRGGARRDILTRE